MAIVSSVPTPGHAQRNGARRVIETHTWSDGTVTTIEYGPVLTESLDLQAVANARARRLEELAAEQEFEAVIRAA